MPLGSRWLLVGVVGAYALAAGFMAWEVPEPYMDEIFHVPQAKLYCAGKYDYWDPSITTPPGLYLLSKALLWIIRLPCNTTTLRLSLLPLTLGVLPWLLASILRSLSADPSDRTQRPTISAEDARRQAWTITTFPIVFFFSLLYYTDVPSLVAVLGCYAAALQRRHGVASAVGLLSLTFRQTNVVWVAFVAVVAVLRDLQQRSGTRTARKEDDVDPVVADIRSPAHLVSSVIGAPLALLRVPSPALRILAWYAPVPLAFACFLAWNGSIVLGHQEHHSASLHLPQVGYFAAFAGGMGWPVLLAGGLGPLVAGVARGMAGSGPKLLLSVAAMLVMAYAVRFYTIEHPFLLADNRHYFFYVWRRLFKRFWWFRYAAIPGYLASGQAWLRTIRANTTLFWLIAFFGATAVTLVSTPLVEPRYFLIPYVVLRVQTGQAPRPTGKAGHAPIRSSYSELAWYMLVNAATLALFLSVKFRWEGWEGWMRFMW